MEGLPDSVEPRAKNALGHANDDKPAGRVALMHDFDHPAASIHHSDTQIRAWVKV